MVSIIVIVAFFGLFYWLAKCSHERRAEQAARGQLQSPLHRFGGALALLLVALIAWIVIIYHRGQEIPALLWIAVLANAVALFFVNRVLKWRFGGGILS